jgi:hypothetical protein
MVSRDLVPMQLGCAGPRGTGKPLEIAGQRTGHTTVGGDNDRQPKSWFYWIGHWWLKSRTPTDRSKGTFEIAVGTPRRG